MVAEKKEKGVWTGSLYLLYIIPIKLFFVGHGEDGLFLGTQLAETMEVVVHLDYLRAKEAVGHGEVLLILDREFDVGFGERVVVGAQLFEFGADLLEFFVAFGLNGFSVEDII